MAGPAAAAARPGGRASSPCACRRRHGGADAADASRDAQGQRVTCHTPCPSPGPAISAPPCAPGTASRSAAQRVVRLERRDRGRRHRRRRRRRSSCGARGDSAGSGPPRAADQAAERARRPLAHRARREHLRRVAQPAPQFEKPCRQPEPGRPTSASTPTATASSTRTRSSSPRRATTRRSASSSTTAAGLRRLDPISRCDSVGVRARRRSPSRPSGANGDTCTFGQYKGEKGELTWAVDGKKTTGNPADYKHEGRRDRSPSTSCRRAPNMPFPPAACTAFAEISDGATAEPEQELARARRSTRPPPRLPADHHHGPGGHQHVDTVNRGSAGGGVVKAVVLVGGEGTRPAPAHVHDAQAAAPDRQPGVPRAPAHLARRATASTRSCCRSATCPTRSRRTSPTGRFGDLTLQLRGRGRAARHRRRDPVRRRSGIDERFVVCNGDVLTDARPRRARRVPRRARRRGHDLPHAGRRPVRVRRGAHARRRRGRRVRREAAEGQGAHQLDQRRHLRARAVGARAHPRPADRVDRARDVPADARGARAGCTRWRATRTGSTSARPRSTSQAHADVLAGALGGAPAAGCPRAHAGRVGAGRRRASTPTRGSRRRCCIGDGRRVADGARVAGSVVGAGVDRRDGRPPAALGGARPTPCSQTRPRSIDSVVGARRDRSAPAPSPPTTPSSARRRARRRARASGARVRRPDPTPPTPLDAEG